MPDALTSLGSPMQVDPQKKQDELEGSPPALWIPSPPQFEVDQKVWAKDQENIHNEATIRKVRLQDNEWRFFVHYNGWNARWDTWLPADAIALDTPENRELFLDIQLARQKSLAELELASKKQKRSQLSTPNSKESSKRRKHNSIASQTPPQTIDYEFCELPLTLKTVLVDEFDKVTRPPRDNRHILRVVHELPASVTVQQMVHHFAKNRRANSENHDDIEAFESGVLRLFEEALPKCLLYPQERPQYQVVIRDNKNNLADIYGCEYLLRLIIRLPLLLTPSTETTVLMGPLLMELIVLMQKNRQACFKGNYRAPTSDELLDWELKATTQES